MDTLLSLERANLIASRTRGTVEYIRLIRQRGNPIGHAEITDVTDANAEESESATSDQDMEVEPGTASLPTAGRPGDRKQFQRWLIFWRMNMKFVWRMEITRMQMQSSGILADGERWNYWSFGGRMQSQDTRSSQSLVQMPREPIEWTQCTDTKESPICTCVMSESFLLYCKCILAETISARLLQWTAEKVGWWSKAHNPKEECVRFAFPCTRMTLAQIEMNV